MAMELYILSDLKLISIDAWQQAIDDDGRGVRLSTGRTFAELQGALPVEVWGRRTAIECDHWNANDVMREAPDILFNRRWK